MNLSTQIANHVREVYFGGNWCITNIKDCVADVTWQHATTPVYSFNTIADLVYHINYYVSEVINLMQGEAFAAKDDLSFNHPPIHSQKDWDKFLAKVWHDGETASNLIAQLPESTISSTFVDVKYGNYYRNLNGIIEHLHYHLGQIVLIKKILLEQENK